MIIRVSCENLTELDVPKMTTNVYCDYNKIEKLVIPEGVLGVYCHNNNLKSLTLPDGLRSVNCEDNPNLKEVRLPPSLKWARLDPNTKIINLDEVVNNPFMNIYFIDNENKEIWT